MTKGHKDQKICRKDFSRVLGRIHVSAAERNPETGIAPPFFLIRDGTRRLSLERVLARILIAPDASDHDVVACMEEPGLRPADVMMARAYLHRFGPDVMQPRALPEDGKILLLDENTPPETMLSLSQSFGWATHVQAEGLSGRDTDDELIWDFALEHNIAGIVTRDTDFLGIHRRRFQSDVIERNFAPSLIFVEGNMTYETLNTLFSSHAVQIRTALGDTRAGCVLHPEKECRPL